MTSPGVIYVLVNPSIEGLVKVGRTEGLASERAQELSRATGVPTPFMVVFEAPFGDSAAAEAFVHSRLSARGFRLVNNREFFTASPTEAIRAVIEAQTALGSADDLPSRAFGDSDAQDIYFDPDSESNDEEAPFNAVLKAAEAARYGYGDALQDPHKALALYKKAAALGSVNALRGMGELYLDEAGPDYRKALECFEEGARKGDGQCFVGMACIYMAQRHLDNAEKCWDRYFSSYHFRTRRRGVGDCALQYLAHVHGQRLPLLHREEITIPEIMNAMKLRGGVDLRDIIDRL